MAQAPTKITTRLLREVPSPLVRRLTELHPGPPGDTPSTVIEALSGDQAPGVLDLSGDQAPGNLLLSGDQGTE